MDQDERIRKLEDTRQEVLNFAAELDRRLSRGKITPEEYRLQMKEKLSGKTKEEVLAYLDSQIIRRKKENHASRKKTFFISSAAAMILLIIGIFAFNSGGNITGHVVENTLLGKTYTGYSEEQLSFTDLVSLKISGSLEGSGAKVVLRAGDTDYLVGRIESDKKELTESYSLKTDKSTYTIGETANIILTPEDENASIYLIFGEETIPLTGRIYTPTAAGDYTVRAIIVTPNDILRLETNFTVVNSADAASEQADNTVSSTTTYETQTGFADFTALCDVSCLIPAATDPLLIIEPDEGSKITITEIITETAKTEAPALNATNETETLPEDNLPPSLIKEIPDQTLQIGEERTIDLADYFSDAEGGTIYYDINAIKDVGIDITGSQIKMTGLAETTQLAYIYATDGAKMATSNTFLIIVGSGVFPPVTPDNTTINQTLNGTVNETNNPIGDNASENLTSAIGGLCDNPDPNLRPPECIEGNSQDYFVIEDIYLKNDNRIEVARITPLGNLIIRGKIYEQVVAFPQEGDFRVTVLDENYNEIPVAWISSVTGDLYLKGTLYQEDFFLEPTPSAFVIQNKRNINLAYIDRRTGDLHIKGNLVQEGEVIR